VSLFGTWTMTMNRGPYPQPNRSPYPPYPNLPISVGQPSGSPQAGPTPDPVFEESLPYAEPTFALAISHCDWLPDRVAVMARNRPILLRAGTHVAYREICEKAPNWVWSRIMWGWGAAQGVTHGVYLQDDIDLHPDFWNVVRAMVRAVPNRVLALLSNHPFAPRALAEGHHWLRCGETLGTGYIVPTALMGSFLDARDRRPGTLRTETEDFQLTRWLVETGRRAWHPIPGILQTKPEIPTTDARHVYPCRKGYVPWTDARFEGAPLTSTDYWTPRTLPPDYGATVLGDTRLPRGPFDGEDVRRHA